MEVSKRKASPSGQIFSLPWGHVVYRNAVKSLAWQAPYVRPQGVRGTVWSQWTCIPATWCGEGPVERANVVKADGDGDCYTVQFVVIQGATWQLISLVSRHADEGPTVACCLCVTVDAAAAVYAYACLPEE